MKSVKEMAQNIKAKIQSTAKNFLADESGQGTAEYVLLLVIVVGLVFAFKGQITKAFNSQIGKVSSSIENFDGQ